MKIGFGVEVDMWALGVTLFVLLSGCPPFYEDTIHDLFRLIREGTYEFFEPEFAEVSSEAKALIAGLLCVNKASRLTSAQVMEHPWVAAAATAVAADSPDSPERRPAVLLPHVPGNMHRHNVRRKFKAVIHVIQALRYFEDAGAVGR